jgi:hypothetical protein
MKDQIAQEQQSGEIPTDEEPEQDQESETIPDEQPQQDGALADYERNRRPN